LVEVEAEYIVGEVYRFEELVEGSGFSICEHGE
jgi:hypothetical protein